jgi:hypothetical protein
VLLPDLPYADPSRLVVLDTRNTKTGAVEPIAYLRDWADWRDQNRSFDSMGLYGFAMLTAEGDQPEALWGVSATASLLPILGVTPMFGRFFRLEEDVPGSEHVIILSYDVWRRRYGADPAIVGKTIDLIGKGARDWQVVGVMPRGFNFPLAIPTSVNPPTRQMAYWIPAALDTGAQKRDGMRFDAIGRLRRGVTIQQAGADLNGIAARLAAAFPRTNADRGVRIASLAEDLQGSARTGDVARLILGHGLRTTVVGIGLGMAAAFALTRVMTSLLYGVTATDPAIFAGVPALLAAVELMACYLPARRASRVDPVEALRSE